MTELEVPATAVPSTVKSKVVSGELAGSETLSVAVLPDGTGLGLKVAVAPLGMPEAERVIGSEKPEIALVLISVLKAAGRQTNSFRMPAQREKLATLGC